MSLSAVITAAAPRQRHLLHQTLAKADAKLETVAQYALDLLMPEDREPLVDRVAIIIPKGDTERFSDLIENRRHNLTLIEQEPPLGYVQALYQARQFVGNSPFLHLVGDHFYMANEGPAWTMAASLIETFHRESTSISAVQPTREALLPYFGAVGGSPKPGGGTQPLYRIETVIEKPTPTEAEQKLIVPGLRAGHYLCFFGLHIFSPSLMQILDEGFASGAPPATLSEALQILAKRETLLATILPGTRFDLGARYGILQAQLALGLQGPDREEILAMMLELLAR
jgi:UTP--glucose-1-phosphate uridylyltransferase